MSRENHPTGADVIAEVVELLDERVRLLDDNDPQLNYLSNLHAILGAIEYSPGMRKGYDAPDRRRAREAERQARWMAEREAQLAEKRAWRALPRWQRVRMLLDTLGDKRMSAGELARQLRDVPGGSGFSHEYTRMLSRELVEVGELVEAKATSGRCRFVYSRQTKLSGPIVALEVAFHDCTQDDPKRGET